MSPPPHALSCFTSPASPATLPACTSSLAALPSLAALFFSCSTSVTCSTFLLLQHFLHLQHFSSLAAHPSLAARLHLRPADLARLARRPAPLTSPAVLHVLPAVLRLQHLRPTDQRLLHLHGTCFLSFPRHLLSARAHSGTCKHGAARHNTLLRMRLPLRPAPDAPRPLHLRHRGCCSPDCKRG